MPERVKKTKCAGGVAKKIEGGGMPERVKKTKCGGGVCENNLKVGVCRRGNRRQNTGGVLRKKLRGDAGEGKEDKMRGLLREKFERGVCRRG